MRGAGVVGGLTVAAVLWLAPAAHAVPVRGWTYEELWREAGLVVIGTVESSRDADENFRATKSDDRVPVYTTFRVAATLQGDADRETVTVLHYRYHQPEVAEIEVVDGPAFIKFDAKAKAEYLLFLRLREDGHWEPVSGQFSPGQAVRILNLP